MCKAPRGFGHTYIHTFQSVVLVTLGCPRDNSGNNKCLDNSGLGIGQTLIMR